ncbi:uncharacterized protein EDB91DRAFT_1083145 [Suillus paluster]|uniref:uncharacterized protein n=1 Tax=Suillus paluster TaxID=48578 RepID=UPI001B866E67|nr:uncharacterized protein EDB91DRAFT_1083145 [Suillus paluster]KAG1737105.1 hypothetical protein EDB91DRAFT_1083145 [Suillus paluster]
MPLNEPDALSSTRASMNRGRFFVLRQMICLYSSLDSDGPYSAGCRPEAWVWAMFCVIVWGMLLQGVINYESLSYTSLVESDCLSADIAHGESTKTPAVPITLLQLGCHSPATSAQLFDANMSSIHSKSFEIPKIATVLHPMRPRPFKLVRPKIQPMFSTTDMRSLLTGLSSLQNNTGYDELAMTRAFDLIQDWVGMHGLARKYCFNPKGRSVPPEWFVRYLNPDDEPEDIETVHIHAVCSDQEDDFEWRPLQKRVDLLTDFVGRSPRW